MTRWTSTAVFLALAIASATAGACGSIVQRYDNIGDILSNPDSFSNRDIRIRAKVKEFFTIPVVDVTFVLLSDGTSEIWCRCRKKPSKQGEVMEVVGSVQRGIEILDRRFGVAVVEKGESRPPPSGK